MVWAVAVGRAGNKDIIVSGGDDGTARVWDAVTGQSIGQPLTGHTDRVNAVAIGHAGDRDIIASASYDGTVRLWDPRSGTVLHVAHTLGPVNGLALGAQGAVVYIAVGLAVCALEIREDEVTYPAHSCLFMATSRPAGRQRKRPGANSCYLVRTGPSSRGDRI
jgi:hypothetical protein